MEIIHYDSFYRELWDRFAAAARQRSFLFQRGYMDYHADRFEDASLMAFHRGKLVGLLPANRRGDEIVSHGGLTYGGWLTPLHGPGQQGMLEIWNKMCELLRNEGVKSLVYKRVPDIYSLVPAQEDRYALFRAGAVLEGLGASCAISREHAAGFNENARRALAKSRRAGVSVGSSDDYPAFWRILEDVLGRRHGCRPVHSVAEMELLAGRFPENIRLWLARDPQGAPLAGTVVYRTDRVAHAQYIASSPQGQACGALAAVFTAAIADAFEGSGVRADYFDFGISTEDGGMVLNEGLIRQKEGFGGTVTGYEIYRQDLEIKNM